MSGRQSGVWFSFRYAMAGFAHMWTNERNFRLHVVAAAAVLWLGDLFAIAAWEWAVVILTAAAVLSLESVNTAIERVGDMDPSGPSPLARIAKDTAASAVLTMAIASVVVAVIIFVPKLAGLPGAVHQAVAGHPIRLVMTTAAVVLILLLSLRPAGRES